MDRAGREILSSTDGLGPRTKAIVGPRPIPGAATPRAPTAHSAQHPPPRGAPISLSAGRRFLCERGADFFVSGAQVRWAVGEMARVVDAALDARLSARALAARLSQRARQVPCAPERLSLLRRARYDATPRSRTLRLLTSTSDPGPAPRVRARGAHGRAGARAPGEARAGSAPPSPSPTPGALRGGKERRLRRPRLRPKSPAVLTKERRRAREAGSPRAPPRACEAGCATGR